MVVYYNVPIVHQEKALHASACVYIEVAYGAGLNLNNAEYKQNISW